jgi:hypothetical protein
MVVSQMKEFVVQLFLVKFQKIGIFGSIANMLSGSPNPRSGDPVELEIGKPTEYGYNYVNVYLNERLIGEIRKRGIDDLMRKGTFVGAKYLDKNKSQRTIG